MSGKAPSSKDRGGRAAVVLVAGEHGAAQSQRKGLLGARLVSGVDRRRAHVGVDWGVDVWDGGVWESTSGTASVEGLAVGAGMSAIGSRR